MANLLDAKVITLAQLGEHKTQQDMWIAVHGKVYDLTTFAVHHPGGIDVLKDAAGTDGSETYEYAGHSEGAMKTMQRFLVGGLAGYVSDLAHVEAAPGDSAAKTNSSSKAAGWSSTPTLMSLGARARLPLLVVAVLCVLAGLYRGFGAGVIGNRKGGFELELGQGGVNTAQAFWGGLLVASSLSCAGLGFLYSQFSKTLKFDNEVFAYPAVIPRRVRR